MRIAGILAILGWLCLGKPHRILILGDSLTEGLGVDSAAAFPALLQRKLDSLAPGNFQILNGGVSGSTTSTALGRLRWYAKAKPEYVLFALGSNDGLRGIPVAETRRNLEAALRFAQAQGWVVMLAGLRVPPNYGPEYSRAFEKLYPDLARAFKIPCLQFLLSGVGGDPAMNQADGIHPNEKGHLKIAENLFRFLRPQIEPKASENSLTR